MTRLRLSYTKFADVAAGQVGEPGEGYLVSPVSGVFVHVRRDDPSELLAFQIEHFSETFTEARDALGSFLGDPIMDCLAELWASVPSEATSLPVPSGDELERVMKTGNVELITTIPEANETVRAERIHFLDSVGAWASDTEAPKTDAVAQGVFSGLGKVLRDAVSALVGATDAVVVGARLTPVVVRGELLPGDSVASEIALTSEAVASLGEEAQARATLSDGALQIWMVGLTNLAPGQELRIVATTRSLDPIETDCVVEGAPPRAAARLAWPDPQPPSEIAIVIFGP